MRRLNWIVGPLLAAGLTWTGAALAQSTGASPADPNNARNQYPAPSNTQPADPAAASNPFDRVPTAPQDRLDAADQAGGQTGRRPDELPPAPVVGPPVGPPVQ